MTLIRNGFNHPYTTSAGRVLAPNEQADINVIGAQEQDAIAIGKLIVMDPSYVPPAQPAPPLDGYWQLPVATLDDLPSASNHDGDVRLVRDLDAAYVWTAVTGQWVPLTEAEEGGLDGTTVDSSAHFRLIMFANGTVRAIPYETPTPSTPTGIAADVRLSSVKLTWTAVSGAAQYAIYRNGTQIATSALPSYRDIAIAVGATYTYRVQTLDAYGQRSAQSSAVTAFVDPAENSAPTVTVKAWPSTFPSDGKTLLRVNAADVDAQTLTLALGVSAGSLSATEDPSIWMYAP